MSSDDVPQAPQNKPSTSSFADVFKTLAVGRPKSQSPVLHAQNAGGALSPEMEGRRGSRVTFGFEALHRGSVAAGASEASTTPSLDTILHNLAADQPLQSAADEAEKVVRYLHGFSGDQVVAVWEQAAHLLDHPSSPEARASGGILLENVSARQDLSLAGRKSLFLSISQPSHPDVIARRVKALISLSDYGRKFDFTEEPVLRVIAAWIVPLYEQTAAMRSKIKRSRGQRPSGATFDEAILGELFQHIVDVVTLQRHSPSPEVIELVLNHIFTVCKKTSAAVDIKNSLGVFDAIITTSGVPDESFIPLLEVLCSIHASVKSLAGPTSRAVRSLAKSGKQSDMIQTLHTFLMETTERPDRNLNVTRGAVDIFRDLLVAYGQDGMPTISFERLIASLHQASLRKDGRIDTDILEVCLNALQGEFSQVSLKHDWTEFVNVMLACSDRAIDITAPTSPTSNISPVPLSAASTPPSKASLADDVRSNIIANLARISAALEALWPSLDKAQKLEAWRLLADIHKHLTHSQSELAIRLLGTERLCHPSASDGWITYSWKLVQDYILDREKAPETRILALATFRDAYFSENAPELYLKEGLVRVLTNGFADEDSYLFLQELVAFLVDGTASSDEDTLNLIVDTLSQPMSADENTDDMSPSGTKPVPHYVLASDTLAPSLSDATTWGLIRIFLKGLETKSQVVVKVYQKLIDIASSTSRPSDSRLSALRLLFRLRCDTSGVVHIASSIDNGHLTASMLRTVESAAKSNASEESSVERSRDNDTSSTPNSRSSLKDQSVTPLGGHSQRVISRRPSRWVAPIWAFDDHSKLPDMTVLNLGSNVYAFKAAPCKEGEQKHEEQSSEEQSGDEQKRDTKVVLKVNLWAEAIIALLQREKDWDIYSYVSAHVSAQLANRDFFRAAIPQIKLLRSVLCEQIKNESFPEPLGWTGVKKKDIAICLLDALTMLVSFHAHFAKGEQDEIVRSFMYGIGSWEGTSRGCIHALSVCCHEIPLSVTKSLNAILDKMSKVITRSHIAVHILEFLALLARLPEVYVNLRDEEIRTVFGICIRYLQTSREQRYKNNEAVSSRSVSMPTRISNGSKDPVSNPSAEAVDIHGGENVARYVYHLTYHVMVFWFLSLKLQDRPNHVGWITKRLLFNDEQGKEVIEEQSQVFIDMMQRVAYSDLGDTIPFDHFPPSPSDGPVVKKTWIVGTSIITIETACASGLNQVTKRQASGTTYSIFQQRTAPVLPHQIPTNPGSYSLSDDPSTRTSVLPSHALLQMTASAFPTSIPLQPLPLPDDDFTRRAISAFDRNSIVDGHKIGVLYIGEGQTDETEIFANDHGSPDYEFFIASLGTKVSIENPKFNPQGLYHERDGKYIYAWRDRVSEIIYHIATMMPTNLEADPQCVNKKQHIGNDFVNIIFNRSGSEFDFNTISTQFNFVDIVITPASRVGTEDMPGKFSVDDFNHRLYTVKVLSKPGIPELSAAAIPKVICGKNLAAFVRIIGLNASVFSLVCSHGGEYISSWQNRLREIRRLRDRAYACFSPEVTSPDASSSNLTGGSSHGDGSFPPSRRNTKHYADDGSLRSGLGTERNLTMEANAFPCLDFSRWTR
ncbi:tuberin [Nannizzia gypsea CBS 118893]|uniref:Tuberin n=1 Tax=Arthroderma gypseum (strain ATCC MYA-4604 / CBS 118893) TaxID=535722 RepID=E5QYT7_ARTGP|nr:tuberin [Nannizzia gypsea CBS 118893]EFQ97275.1 tuberin [Nannizzia gypsea CBS 118893]